MSKNVITVEEDCTLEEAARLMADHRIGGLLGDLEQFSRWYYH